MIAKRLLDAGADLTLRDDGGKTAVDYARLNGKSEVIALLSEPRYADGDRTECESNAEFECESNAKSIANRMKTEMWGGAVLSARGPGIICRGRTNDGELPWDAAERSQRTPSVLGQHSASPLHALHIWRRVQNDQILRAVLNTTWSPLTESPSAL